MSNRETVLRALEACAGDEPILVIHSSLPHLKLPQNVDKWDFLFALRALIEQGRTIVLPAFTFSFCSGENYHYQNRSEVGVLADWAASLSGFSRSQHPIYSYVMGGALADELLEVKNSTTFGDDSYLAAFEKYNARVIMLGCGWEYCTQFHRYEEEAQVPYREYKAFSGYADYGRGQESVQAIMFVRSAGIDAENNFQPVVNSLKKQNGICTTQLWGGTVESTSVRGLAGKFRKLLTNNLYEMVNNGRVVSHEIQQRSILEAEQSLKLAIMGASNLDLVSQSVQDSLQKMVSGRLIECFTSEYGQNRQDVFNKESDLYSFGPGFILFVNRLEDLAEMTYLDSSNASRVEQTVAVYIETLLELRENHSGILFVAYFPLLCTPVFGGADRASNEGVHQLVEKMNVMLESNLQSLPDTYLFDLQAYATNFTEGAVFDPRVWAIGRYPFSERFSHYLGDRLSALVLAASGRTIRMIAVDLDNTLWGGVIGEDGEAALALGGDYPGNAFRTFQRVIKRFVERGIALVLCSKNDEALALTAIDRMPSMVLRSTDVSAHRINWQPKWKNVLSICEEMSLGIESVLFIDDNPAEREQMRHQLPGVKVLELPADPALYSDALLKSPWVECLHVTSEDALRSKKYKARKIFIEQRAKSDNMEDFYASLDITLHLNRSDESNLYRTLQLINKTNQFNATTRRYTAALLDAMANENADVIVVGVDDRLTEFENIGVVIIRWDQPEINAALIDSYLLSCRVLGRGIEAGVLYWLMDEVQKRGVHQLNGEIVNTQRNAPVRNIYQETGFSFDGAKNLWTIKLKDSRCYTPSWLKISGNYGTNG